MVLLLLALVQDSGWKLGLGATASILSTAEVDMTHCFVNLSLLCLVLLNLVARTVVATREGAFIGYSERATSSLAVPADKQCRNLHTACLDWASHGECDANPGFMHKQCRPACKLCKPELNSLPDGEYDLLLSTSLGSIRSKLMQSNAPEAVKMVIDLASQQPDVKASCHFYRNEAIPADGVGPPYGLLQGSMAGLAFNPALEGSTSPVRGSVAFISGTSEFYISLMDHSSWTSGHIVFGYIPDMTVVDAIVASSAYTNFTHPTYGTVMRMMTTKIPFIPSLVKTDGQASSEDDMITGEEF